MSEQKQSKHIGKKIWYSMAIFLSVLVILLSAVSIAGTWIVQNTVSDISVTLFGVVHDTAGQIRNAASNIDQKLEDAQGITNLIAGVTGLIKENIQDKGIIMTLLPEEQEQKLGGSISSVIDAFKNVKQTLLNGIKLYRSIDRLPFVNLPKLSPDQADKIDASLTDIQSTTSELQGNIQQARSGVSDAVGKVESGANKITQRMGETRDNLAELDVKLVALQALMVKLQKIVPMVLIILAVLVTFFAAYVIYTQVELIRLLVQRWRNLGRSPTSLPPADESPVEFPPPAAELQAAPETPAEPAMVHIVHPDQAPADESPDTQ